MAQPKIPCVVHLSVSAPNGKRARVDFTDLQSVRRSAAQLAPGGYTSISLWAVAGRLAVEMMDDMLWSDVTEELAAVPAGERPHLSITEAPTAPPPPQTGVASDAATASALADAGVFADLQPPAKRHRKELPLDMPPSTLALPKVYAGWQQGQPAQLPLFEIGRDDLDSPHVLPVQLMHPAFERVCHVISSAAPPADCMEVAAQMCLALEPYHATEDDMTDAVFPVIKKLFDGFDLPAFGCWTHGTGGKKNPKNDGQTTYTLGGSLIDVGSTRLEANLQSNPANALVQACAYQRLVYLTIEKYLKNPATKLAEKTKLLGFYPYPTLLITMSDVDIQLHGAVIAGTYGGPVGVRSQHLTDKVTFILPRHDEEAVTKLATLMYAVREAALCLHGFYRPPRATPGQVPRATPPPPTELPYHPLPHTARLVLMEPKLVALRKLLWRGDHLLSSGGIASNAGIVVKFARRYSFEVHTLWEKAGLAPPLVKDLCAEGPLGNYHCVVMLDLTAQGFKMVSSLPADQKAVAKQQAEQALLRVPSGTVHGDLRTDNAMLGPAQRLVFLDFEWAGRVGETCYPLNLNRTQFHNGAKAGAPITHKHDVDMVALWG